MLQEYRGAGREEREGGGRESRERRRRERERESERRSSLNLSPNALIESSTMHPKKANIRVGRREGPGREGR